MKGLGHLIRIFRSLGLDLFVAAGHVDNCQRVFKILCAYGAVCRVAEKLGPLGGLRWVWTRQTLDEECVV